MSIFRKFIPTTEMYVCNLVWLECKALGLLLQRFGFFGEAHSVGTFFIIALLPSSHISILLLASASALAHIWHAACESQLWLQDMQLNKGTSQFLIKFGLETLLAGAIVQGISGIHANSDDFPWKDPQRSIINSTNS